MIKGRFIVIGILVSASLMSSVIKAGTAETGDQIEIPVYTVGDYWIYNSSQFQNITGEIRYEVSDIREVQDYWNVTHQCYQINTSMEFSMEWENQTAEGLINGVSYERAADLFAIEYMGEVNLTMVDDEYNTNSYQHSYYQYPGPPTIFPLILGSQYNLSFNMTNTLISIVNGSESFILFEEPGIIQDSVSIDDALHTITTPAGTFECVEITMYSGDENINVTTVRYYSSIVGRDVKRETIQIFQGSFSDMTFTTGEELLEYERKGTFAIPGFSYLGIYCLLGITTIILHRNLKNR